MIEIKDLKEIQKIGLNTLKFIDKVCKENDIKYSLCAGTALGAIRHKGFIPWDDDIDIMMTRENYDKFLNIMDNLQDKNYKCLHFGKKFPNYFYRFCLEDYPLCLRICHNFLLSSWCQYHHPKE